ncbi:hypothetical protein CKO51_14035 [Rhodopirellula sp. SM50]|nr:hypothetical protein CKO51_14035 [Rhodopirellula sp. SM50]
MQLCCIDRLQPDFGFRFAYLHYYGVMWVRIGARRIPSGRIRTNPGRVPVDANSGRVSDEPEKTNGGSAATAPNSVGNA